MKSTRTTPPSTALSIRFTGWAGFLGIISAVVQFVVAFGLYAMKKWAWVLALIGVVLTVVEGIIGIFSGGAFAFMCGSLALVIPVVILIYLLLPNTRRAFSEERD